MSIPLLLTMIPELVKAGVGISQMIKGKRLGEMERPKMDVSPAATDALNLTKFLAGSRSAPGMVEAENNLNESYANTLQVAKEIGTPEIGTAYRNQTRALSDLGVEDQQFRTNMMLNLVQQLNRYGSLQDNVFNYNKVQPYENAIESSYNLQNSGLTNTFDSLSNSMSSIIKTLTSKEAMDGITGTETGKMENPIITATPMPTFKGSEVGMGGSDEAGFVKQVIELLSKLKNQESLVPIN